ncbi:nucleic acid dioxygenase ALKBH1-like isoform X2 [Physella acuta]|nr:nucleic acid dioxygenase ALKBH1-like isoform X2 [Physella acuta]
MIVKNPFLPGCQGYWISRCLADFPSDPDNITNLSALGAERGERLWQDFILKGSTELTKADRLRQLRWTTLGYHYNWTTKEYSAENVGQFPSDVSCLSQYLAACLGFGPYKPQAAIVNYYHMDSTLAAHTDHSEQDHSAPLFSISFGQTALFLIGGVTKCVLPLAVKLKSGDVCVMSGPSRLAYHAVPKILPPTQEEFPAYLQPFVGSLTPQNCCSQGGCGHKTDLCTHTQDGGCGHKTDLCTHTQDGGCGHKTDLCTHTQDGGCGHKTDLCTHTQGLFQDLLYQCPGEDNHALNLAPSFQQYQRDIDQVNYKIYTVLKTLDLTPFARYLKSSRININIRQVLPHGVTSLQHMQH